MPETSATPTPEKKDGPDRTQLLMLAGLVVMGGIIVGLVRVIRSSPCFKHTDGEPPLVEVAKQSAKMRLVEHPLPATDITPDIAARMGSDEADQAPENPDDNGHVNLGPAVTPRKPRTRA